MNDVTFSYSKKTKLLSHITLSLKSGSIHGLLGKNGEGKTTLLKLISGLVFPHAGTVKVLDFEPGKRAQNFLSDIYFLGEDIPESTLSIELYEKVYAPFYPKFNHNDFDNHLREFEINDKKVLLNKLSHGQRKKVYIAFALAANTRLLLMDEPTNGLDIPSKGQFRKMVASAIDEARCLIISTHQVRDLDSLIDNIIIIDEHEILLNEDLASIGEKLTFKVVEANEKSEGVIYAEDTIRGSYQVAQNVNNADTKVDIELLFNAVIRNRQQIKTIFNH